MKARWLSLLVLAAGCEELGICPDQPNGVCPTDGGTDAGATPDAGGGTPDAGGSSDASAPNDAGTADAGGTSTGLPCDVQSIVAAKCQLCHSDPPKYGAPMPLTEPADFTAASAVAGATYGARVKVRIGDKTSPMPPVGQPTLSDAEKGALTAWIDSGMKTSTATCGGTTPPADAGTGGGSDSGVPPGYNDPYAPPDSECDTIFEMRAHGAQSATDTSPFEPPQGGDHYEIFYFVPTWTEKVHTIRIDPIIDNAAVLHHWLLYQEEGNGSGNGTHRSDVGLQTASSQLLSGWAPGNDSVPLARHVGVQTISGPNARFGIELHYNTTGNPANRKDRSGAKICVTKTLREHEASVHWLGTQAIFLLPGDGQATGICTPQVTGGVAHVIAHSPHMHQTGVHLTTSVKRKSNGMTETLHDAPFSFNDQQIFPVKNADREQLIYPGDVLTTTCKYRTDRVITFGPNTDQEMCYNFVVAWPAGSLSNGIAGAVGGKNTCIDPGT